MPKKIVDYSNTIIYKIYCKDQSITDIYVGHTTNFIQRKACHKTACNNEKNDLKIYKIIRENGGWNNWNMIEIEKYNCKDSTEARIKENEHYNQLKSTLNSCPPYVDKNNYFCSKCNLQCSGPTQYEKHIKSIKHNNLKDNNINNEKQPDVSQKKILNMISNFYCEKCDYTISKKSSYDKHLQTQKHKIINCNKSCLKNAQYTCQNCNKQYYSRNGLWMHNKKCNNNILNNTLNINIMEINKDEIIMMLVKQNAELIKQQSEFKNMIIEQQKIMIHNIENK
jgi:hypothetical protein